MKHWTIYDTITAITCALISAVVISSILIGGSIIPRDRLDLQLWLSGITVLTMAIIGVIGALSSFVVENI